jgi:hypothetical protein
VWLIYALGGGWGHLTRAVALATAAAPRHRVRILTNSPYAKIVAARLPALDLVTCDDSAAVHRQIEECRPSCLIVDTFPRGIVGELVGLVRALDTRKVLVHRDLNPRYVRAFDLRAFVAANYDLVLVPGAGEGGQLGDLPAAVATRPWLVRSAGEIPPRETAREVLRLGRGEESCVLICAAGKEQELDWYAAVLAHIRGVPVRMIANDPRYIQYWPAMDLFGGASVVVGGGGYNTVRECQAWRVPLVAKPWARTYDRQAIRATAAAVAVVQEPEEAAAAALRHRLQALPGPPQFVNGTVDAVRRIEQLA